MALQFVKEHTSEICRAAVRQNGLASQYCEPTELAKTTFKNGETFKKCLKVVQTGTGYVWHWEGTGGNNGKTTMVRAMGAVPLVEPPTRKKPYPEREWRFLRRHIGFITIENPDQLEFYEYNNNLIIIHDSYGNSVPITLVTDISNKVLVTHFDRTFNWRRA
uniref:Uncharacterized protein n=1 Tax=Marseillevirus LCMAC201 TaxID=2506605 RepID=A0A481YXE3_9VIRU|nr:MAG: hypothetical protein LCMAC201_01360 [Marseillevirus LCMAC201]